MRRRDKLRVILARSPGNPIGPQARNVPDVPTSGTTRCPGTGTSIQESTANINGVTKNCALQLALERHLNTLPTAEQEAFREAAESVTDQNLLLDVKAYDANHKGKSYFRPQAEALARFLGVLDRFMAGVTIGIQANPQISAIVVGGVRVVITLAFNFTIYFAELSEMLCRFGDFLGPLTEYAKASAQEEVVLETRANVYGDLPQFYKHAHETFSEHAVQRKWISWRVFWRLQWIPFEDEFGRIEADLQHHLHVLGHSAQAVRLNVSLSASRVEQQLLETLKGSSIPISNNVTWSY